MAAPAQILEKISFATERLKKHYNLDNDSNFRGQVPHFGATSNLISAHAFSLRHPNDAIASLDQFFGEAPLTA